MDADEILGWLGGWRRYQLLVYLSLCFVYMRGAWQVFVILFIGADPGHNCYIPVQDNVSTTTMYAADSCHVLVQSSVVNETKPCPHGYQYDDTEFRSTIVSQYDLVCDKNYMVDLASTIYMIGNSLGAVFITPLSDKFGRRLVLLVCLLIQAVVGAAVIFSPNYIVFVILRFLVGCFNMAIALITYVMLTELFPAEKRTRPSVAVNLCWSIGLILLSLIGYLVRDWKLLNLAITLPNIITVVYIWFLPESIPWLVSRQRYQQLKVVIKRAANFNGISLQHDLMVQVEEHINRETPQRYDRGNSTSETETEEVIHWESSPGSGQTLTEGKQGPRGHPNAENTIMDLFRTPKIRRYTFTMFYLWFVASLGYFGILFSTPTLHGNIFLNLAISGAVEIPALLICMFVLERTGRRRPLVAFMMLCGVMNITTLFIPKETDSGTDLGPLILSLAMVGKFGITGAYSTIYLMSVEIFPTAVRNQALGLSSFFENTGGIAAPFIVYGAKNLTEMPLVLFGVLTVIGGLLAMLLPETGKQALPETVEDVAGISKGTREAENTHL